MAQNLYYTPVSSSLVLIREGDSPYYWYDITSLQISGSAYDATISGSDFGGTAATARIYAYSGSVQVVSFPLEDTNLYYPPFPIPLTIEDYYAPSLTATSSFSTIYWNFDLDPSFSPSELSGSGISIYNLTNSSSFLNITLESANGGFPLISGNSYLFAVSGSGSYDTYLYINDITSGSNVLTLSASNAYVSASYTLLEFHNYSITSSITNTYSP